MWRTIGGVVAGFVAWWVVASILNIGLRLWLPGYTPEVEHTLAFTLPMKIWRLSIAVAAALAAGMVVGAIAPESRRAPWIAGIVILLPFLPIHLYFVWNKLPVWYHLSFLVPLVPLVVLGAQIWPHHAGATEAA
jgi:hypothetical protein